MIGVIDSQQEWDALLACFEHSDFYHTYGYHRIAKDKSDHPILIKYSEDDKIIALPLLLRQIEGTPYMDAISGDIPGP